MTRKGAIAFACLALAAPPAHSLKLEDAFGRAMQSNPSIREAQENARRLHESVPLAISQRLPALNLNSRTDFSRSFNKHFNRRGILNSNRQSIGVSLSQNLYSSGRNTAAIRQAEHDVRRSHAELEAVEQRVLLRVAIAYFDVLRARQSVRLRKRSVDAFKTRSEHTISRYRVGQRTQADIAQAEAEWQIAVADLAAARAELRSQQTVFESLVGIPATDLEEGSGIAGLPSTLDAAAAVAGKAHPAIRAAGHAVRGAEQTVTVAVALSGMRIDLEGSLSSFAGHNIGQLDYNTEARIGVQISVPLYRGGSGGANIRQARKALRQRRLSLLSARRNVVRDAAIAWNNLLAARQRHTALSSALEAARVALNAIQRQAEIGERSTREILDAERNKIDYELAIFSAERDISVYSYRLKAAIGALTAKSLGIENIPDLEREAAKTRRKLAPALLSPGRN